MPTERWKFAFTTRRVRHEAISGVVAGDHAPRPGDLVLAEVEEIGQHKRIELTTGRRAHLFPGDRIVVAYGNRYAPDQFEAVVPAGLEPCSLVAAGGVAAQVLTQHETMEEATRIAPIGLLVDASGRRMNLADAAMEPVTAPVTRPPTVAVLGSSMNSGKTTTAASLVHGLRDAGLRVGAAKLTGTGAGPDLWLMQDSGAEIVWDFTDAGAVSTSLLQLPRLLEIVDILVGNLAATGVDAIVLEVADGLLQPETAALLGSSEFAATIDGIVFAGREAMGAAEGVRRLRERGHRVLAVSGVMTRAPLAVREARGLLDAPVLTRDELALAEVAPRLLPEGVGSSLAAA